MKMKIEYTKEAAYIRALTQALYREYCNRVGDFGAASEIVNILYEMLIKCMECCDKYNVDYNLNYDNG